MNKLALSLAVIAGLVAAACNGNQTGSTSVVSAISSSDSTAPAMNIRYIDADSVAAHYNLAKDLSEMQIRTFSKLENARQSRATEIQRFGQQIEQKMRSNGYLTEDSYNADVAKFNKMQQDAQNQLANLERNAQQEMAAQQQQLNDSIESFIKIYNAVKGYDAILYRAAGVYFNPSLDITAEVIEGLNARYNKVADKD